MEFSEKPTVHPSLPNYALWIPLDEKNRVLLQRKDGGHPYWPNMWCNFGGKLERKEGLADALVRESVEELGKKINLSSFPKFFVSQIFSEGVGEKQRSVNVNYYGVRFDGNLSRISLGEGAGFSIFDEDEFRRYGDLSLIVPPNFESIKRFYDTIKQEGFEV